MTILQVCVHSLEMSQLAVNKDELGATQLH